MRTAPVAFAAGFLLVAVTSFAPAGIGSPTLGPVDTIPFRGNPADTLGRMAGVPGWGNARWDCQDAVRSGTGTAYRWPATDGPSFVAAVDSAEAHQSPNNCHDIVLMAGGFYQPNFGGVRYDDLDYVRVSGQTAPGEGPTFRNYGGAESRGARGRVYEHFRIRSPGSNGGMENVWRCRACSEVIQKNLSIAWATETNNLMSIQGGTEIVPLSGDSARHHTVWRNLLFEPDADHATHFNIASTPDTITRRPSNVSVIQNLFHGPGRRMPRVGSQTDSIGILHNIGYNWQNWAAETNANSDTGPSWRVDVIGYLAKPGPRSDPAKPLRVGQNDSTAHRLLVRDIQGTENDYEVNADPDSLIRGSKRVVGCTASTVTGPGATNGWCPTDDDPVALPYFTQDTMPTGHPWSLFTLTPFNAAAKAIILERSGHSRGLTCGGAWEAWGAARDTVDLRAVQEFNDSTGASDLIDTEIERTIGAPADGPDCPEADGDGLPDDWETEQCGSATCVPGWSEWVNGRWAGDWYLHGCNLDGTLVGDRSTPCGGSLAAPPFPPTFGAVDRYVYFVGLVNDQGVELPDFDLSLVRFSAWRPAGDSAMVVTCEPAGTATDSAGVHNRLAPGAGSWSLPAFTAATDVRDWEPGIPNWMEC